jgi:hypothetical protein
MTEPRKKKSRKTGRPLEGVPMRKLVKRVKDELRERIRKPSRKALINRSRTRT